MLILCWPLAAHYAIQINIIFDRLRHSPLACLSYTFKVQAISLKQDEQQLIAWSNSHLMWHYLM